MLLFYREGYRNRYLPRNQQLFAHCSGKNLDVEIYPELFMLVSIRPGTPTGMSVKIITFEIQ